MFNGKDDIVNCGDCGKEIDAEFNVFVDRKNYYVCEECLKNYDKKELEEDFYRFMWHPIRDVCSYE